MRFAWSVAVVLLVSWFASPSTGAAADPWSRMESNPDILALEKKAWSGDYLALRDLGLVYRNGLGVERRPDVANVFFDMTERRYLEIAERVGEKEDEAEFAIGQLFYSLENARGENARAAHWFALAAEKGNVNAQYYLGGLYASGDGIAANPDLAARWILAALRQGERNAHELYCRWIGQGKVTRDEAEASRWCSPSPNKP
ncbi:hypothetical protein CU669_01590 [Paramagnetospirillum kuznetsovii]|uniref:Sel1 repeat family protein n=1 Tax=Paramagnetospirillum kuznetsovii TaxID=2053833 RepID=A0A364P383_9PROT|nr:SEL1-like repeat protein [Paramagnetospirillum kuznetsovii]RAU23808.1 hypothetical protein CU669_01590 [Paramagnetospirillum kuznetsovii]